MSSLNSLISRVKELQAYTLDVDITPYCENVPEGEREILSFRQPGVNELFGVLAELDAYRKREPDIAPDTAFNVAMMALCHVAPEIEPNTFGVGELYLQLALQKEPLAFLHIQQEFRAAFPWINVWLANIREKKD